MERQSRQVDVAEFISAREIGRYQVLIFILCVTVVVYPAARRLLKTSSKKEKNYGL